jgi:hypothetical protein
VELKVVQLSTLVVVDEANKARQGHRGHKGHRARLALKGHKVYREPPAPKGQLEQTVVFLILFQTPLHS